MPIAELGEESNRERRSMTALPPVYYLHVWWARRPLVVSRAAILASVLPADADRGRFMDILGIHGDPVAARKQIDEARRTGIRVENPYEYPRAFSYSPSADQKEWIAEESCGDHVTPPVVLDPTAGGGAIPFEAMRLGLSTCANDLNPVAALLLKLTIQVPRELGEGALGEFARVGANFRDRIEKRLSRLFPQTDAAAGQLDTTYLWARTLRCSYCGGLVPLSPNWRLAPDGTAVRLLPRIAGGPNTVGRTCEFEIVDSAREQSVGTVAGGDALCPFPDCGRVIDGAEVKRQAQAGAMGEQLFAVVFRRRIEKRTKTGKVRTSWERGYRAPTSSDDVVSETEQNLGEKLPLWEAKDVIPSEVVPKGLKTAEPIRYGMGRWRDLFNARQLYGHCTAVETFQELLQAERALGDLPAQTVAAFGYLALALDKMLNYNSRMSIWMPTREIMANTFNRHDFAFCWSHAEMAPLIAGLGYDWALEQTAKCVRELIELSDSAPLLGSRDAGENVKVTITCEDGAHLTHVADASVEAVVMDPPYYDNVMYAELSDFFYVWLKRTAGLLYPELFRSHLTDKEHEAVANPALFEGQRGAGGLASLSYRSKMAAIFAECRRVLKTDGIMTLMFTHKASGAWDALAQGLIEAGFVITASWPINTESESSLHIRDKAAANSTIFLACRPRMSLNEMPAYWDDLEREVRAKVRTRIGEFQAAGIRGVDLYLASFGPALEVLSRQWPVQRVTPRPAPANGKRAKRVQMEIEDVPSDPYAVTPEDALDAARGEVKRWRLERLSQLAARDGLDPLTSWFVLAWDAFASAVFPYDEALRLARVCGVSLDDEVVKRVAGKKGDHLTLWDSSQRAANAALGPPDGSRSMLDAVHHAAHLARTRSLEAGRSLLEEYHLVHNPAFVAAFDALRQVLPVSREYSAEALPNAAVGAGDDFHALEDMRKLLYANELPPPHQLELDVPLRGT
jgi:adenine-specific DNA methylase